MPLTREEKFKREHYKFARLSFFAVILFQFILFILFTITPLTLYLSFLFLASLDIYSTNKAVTKNGKFDYSRELNAFPRLIMKIFKERWIIFFIIFLPLFYYFIVFKGFEAGKYILLFMLGVYVMVIRNNFMIVKRDELGKKYGLDLI